MITLDSLLLHRLTLTHTHAKSQKKDFDAALQDLCKDYEYQKNHPTRGGNKFMAGISGHNIAVLYVLSDQTDQALPLFLQAATLKRAAFGSDHPEVAVSKELHMHIAFNQHILMFSMFHNMFVGSAENVG